MRYTVYCAFVLLAAACGHTSSSSSGGTTSPGAVGAKPGLDVAALAKREAEGELTAFTLNAPDNSLSFNVLAKAQPTLTKKDQALLLQVPIGSQAPIVCVVGPAPDLATDQIAQRRGVEKFEREISDIDAGELEGAAFIASRTFYTFDDHGTKTIGEIKTAAARHNQRFGAACVHDELGYGMTLRRVLGSIVGSLKVATDKVKPVYRSVGVIKIKDRPVGVTELTLAQDDSGHLWAFTAASTMVPANSKDFAGSDEYAAELPSAKGELERGVYVATVGAAEPQFEISLTRDKSGYHASGKVQGKPVDGAIATKTPLLSTVRAARMLRELVSGKRRELVLPEYHPGTDPLAFSSNKVTRSDDKEFPFREENGRITSLSDFDEQGLMRKSRMNAGPVPLDFTRVSQTGKFPASR